jgi:hypothetical protein
MITLEFDHSEAVRTIADELDRLLGPAPANYQTAANIVAVLLKNYESQAR